MPICSRCGKDVDGVHTCVPTEVYEAEKALKERSQAMTNRDRVLEVLQSLFDMPDPTPEEFADRLAAEGMIADDWISVLDRMPTQEDGFYCKWSESYLVLTLNFYKQGSPTPILVEVGKFIPSTDGLDGYTHWRRVSQAPKAENTGGER